MKTVLNELSKGKVVHFVGIGGIGMSSLAQLMHQLGFIVQGSDLAQSKNVSTLRHRGIKVWVDEDSAQAEGSALDLTQVDFLVISSAIGPNHPELKQARALGLPIYTRARMLGTIMHFYKGVAVAGTHGKTTTTSLIGDILIKAKLDPTVVVGGIVQSWHGNMHYGDGDLMIAEADESDGSFLDLSFSLGIVTNIDNEHLSFYKTFENLKEHFRRFLRKLPFYGQAILCLDSPGVAELIPHLDRNILTYGMSSGADYEVQDLEITAHGTTATLYIKAKNISLPVAISLYGKHNMLNAAASFAAADVLGVDHQVILETLAEFKGVERRFTKVGSYQGSDIFDDYAHHPTEILAALKAAKGAFTKPVVALVQPHRYSRVKDHFDEFISALAGFDTVVLMPVYSAQEEPNGYDSKMLHDKLKTMGVNSYLAADEGELVDLLNVNLVNPSIVVAMGAGDITHTAKKLPGLLSSNN